MERDLRTSPGPVNIQALTPTPSPTSEFARYLRLGVTVAGYAIAMLAVGILLAVTVPAFAGFHTVTVYGGSMGDSLPAGSVAITRPVPSSALAVGDIIAIGRNEGAPPTLHRIVAIDDTDDGRVITTRGDANETNDPLPLKVSGKGDRVVYHVPWIGYVFAFSRTQLGIALLLGIPAAWWFAKQLVALQRSISRRVRHETPVSGSLAISCVGASKVAFP